MRHRIRFGRCLALVALSLPSPAPARDAPPVPGGLQVDPAGAPVALPASAPIVLDGRLDDAAWREAVVIRGFRQREPREGADASLPTDVRVTYDARALYVAVHAFDPEPSAIVGLMTRRDTGSPSDWIRVLVDSYHDRRTAYEFAVNPAGVKQDRYWFNDTNVDEAWDAVWDVAVGRDGSGWIAEFRIPFSQLRLRHGGETAPCRARSRRCPPRPTPAGSMPTGDSPAGSGSTAIWRPAACREASRPSARSRRAHGTSSSGRMRTT
jgi:hypothetical protein